MKVSDRCTEMRTRQYPILHFRQYRTNFQTGIDIGTTLLLVLVPILSFPSLHGLQRQTLCCLLFLRLTHNAPGFNMFTCHGSSGPLLMGVRMSCVAEGWCFSRLLSISIFLFLPVCLAHIVPLSCSLPHLLTPSFCLPPCPHLSLSLFFSVSLSLYLSIFLSCTHTLFLSCSLSLSFCLLRSLSLYPTLTLIQ